MYKTTPVIEYWPFIPSKELANGWYYVQTQTEVIKDGTPIITKNVFPLFMKNGTWYWHEQCFVPAELHQEIKFIGSMKTCIEASKDRLSTQAVLSKVERLKQEDALNSHYLSMLTICLAMVDYLATFLADEVKFSAKKMFKQMQQYARSSVSKIARDKNYHIRDFIEGASTYDAMFMIDLFEIVLTVSHKRHDYQPDYRELFKNEIRKLALEERFHSNEEFDYEDIEQNGY